MPKAKKQKFKETPLFWPVELKGKEMLILDETLVPDKIKYIKVKETKGAVDAIKRMKTRAFGQFLVVLNTFLLELNRSKAKKPEVLLEQLKKTAKALEKSRPTFPFSEVTSIFIFWAKQAVQEGLDIKEFVGKNILGYLHIIRERKLKRVQEIADSIDDGDSVLTHCNVSGELAMAAKILKKQKKEVHFFATETRPYMQGAKLTAWELALMGAKVTLVADNAVGTLMADGMVNKVIVGSDRSCANKDFANKIGTYQIAVLAREYRVPFYVLTQPSDKIQRGSDIPIEIRDEKELLTYDRKKIIKGDVKGFYPGFDIIHGFLITKEIPINVR